MNKLLVVVDMQHDFIDGALGTKEAMGIVKNVVNKITQWDGDVICTMDTHKDDYLSTSEGKKVPVVHCVDGTYGWQIDDSICAAMKSQAKIFTKETFGSMKLASYIGESNYDYIEFIGLCTDICVISNVLMAKAAKPESTIVVDASCCAGVTPETHEAALKTMEMCQIDIA